MATTRDKPIPRQESLVLPTVINPFVHKEPEFTILDKIQIAVMSVTIFPLRILLITFFMLLGWGLAKIAMLGWTKEDEKSPMQGWRKFFELPLRWCGRMILFVCGFYHIRVRGKKSPSSEAPVICVAPHSSFWDVAVEFMCEHLPSPISRIEQQRVPVLGTLAAYTQPVFVSREDPYSRQNTIKEIKRRAAAKGAWPQIIIFPEGTCTNRTCLITFKRGAFVPAVPVQPVTLKYTNKYDTTTWTWEGPSGFKQFWLTLCQFNNKLEIEFLPVCTPNEEEKNDPILFAKNVRDKMAQSLEIPVTDHTYEDCRLMAYAAKLNMPVASVLVEFQKLNRKLGVNYENLEALLEKFSKVSQKTKGKVTLEQFAAHLDMPVSDALRNMFQLYDRDGSGEIDFREYVIGLHLIAQPANTEDTLQFAFKLFDTGNKGVISEKELGEILHKAFGMEKEAVNKIFSQIEKEHADHITYEEFKAYAQKRPEYASLFTTYRELKDKAETEAGITNAAVQAEFMAKNKTV